MPAEVQEEDRWLARLVQIQLMGGQMFEALQGCLPAQQLLRVPESLAFASAS
jgi:hypothetical protein